MRLTSFSDYSLRAPMCQSLQPDRMATIPQIATFYAMLDRYMVADMAREPKKMPSLFGVAWQQSYGKNDRGLVSIPKRVL